MNGVGSGGREGLCSARVDEFRGLAARRVALGGVAEDVGGSAFAEGAGEGVGGLGVVEQGQGAPAVDTRAAGPTG